MPLDPADPPVGAQARFPRWGVFVAGLAVGLALTALVVIGTQAARRRARRSLPWSRHRTTRSAATLNPSRDEADVAAGFVDNAAAGAARTGPEDAELDEELAQTFPASDPLPYSHRVD